MRKGKAIAQKLSPAEIESLQARIALGRRRKWLLRLGATPRRFRYVDATEKSIVDKAVLNRIRLLAVPPAWRYVRISPSGTTQLQAIGVDGSGRIQYIYHTKFTARQQRKKFFKIERFGEYLPNLRKITTEHISLNGFPREKVLAIMIRLVNSLYIRGGTDKSVRSHKTYGITTLRNDHLTIGRKGKLVFEFVGKSSVSHRKVMVDKELATILRELKVIGSKRKLFHYLDEAGLPHAVKPEELNSYLKTLTSAEYSIKDFRTWGGTLLAALKLAEIGPAPDKAKIKKNIADVVKSVSKSLGNTPKVCKESYVHPVIFEAYSHGIVLTNLASDSMLRSNRKMSIDLQEKALSALFTICSSAT